jgi:hypothetical protein
MSVQTEATGPIRGKTQERIQRAAEGLLMAEEPPGDRCVTSRNDLYRNIPAADLFVAMSFRVVFEIVRSLESFKQRAPGS